ncbi:MAG: hypothetical protein WCI74_07555 [Actinomycetes bacterium]
MVTWILLRRRLGSLDSGTTITTMLRILVAALVATTLGAGIAFGAFAVIKGVSLPEAYQVATRTVTTALLIALVGGALTVGIYAVLAYVLRISELTEIAATVRAKVRR